MRHKYGKDGVCKICYEHKDSHAWPDDPEMAESALECEGPEDLSMWCGPNESVSEMLDRAAERD